jgi:hypothetical protein
MTLVRKLALSLSNRVIRWAAPGCKDWAEGLARETAAIPYDWAALRWALGSTRVLLEPREAPLGSLEEVPGVAHRYVDSLRSGVRIWGVLFQGPIYLLRYFVARTGPQHFGCGLIVFGTAIGALNILMERRRLKEPWRDEVYDHIGTCTLFYRAELERQLQKLWIFPCVFLCYFAGFAFTGIPSGAVCDPFLSGLALLGCASVVPAYLHLRRLHLRRIHRLDALLAQDGEVAER